MFAEQAVKLGLMKFYEDTITIRSGYSKSYVVLFCAEERDVKLWKRNC